PAAAQVSRPLEHRFCRARRQQCKSSRVRSSSDHPSLPKLERRNAAERSSGSCQAVESTLAIPEPAAAESLNAGARSSQAFRTKMQLVQWRSAPRHFRISLATLRPEVPPLELSLIVSTAALRLRRASRRRLTRLSAHAA